MKSFVFAALFAAVLAVPTKYDMSNPCVCEPAVMCPQSFPESCECRVKAYEECAKSLPQHCPRPKLASCNSNTLGKACGGKDSDDQECGSSLVCSYEDVPFPAGSDAKGKCVKKTQTLKQSCGSRGLKNCPGGYECYHKEDTRKVADIPGICVVKGFKPPTTALPGSSTVPTITSSHTTPSGSPIRCGGVAGGPCPAGLKCKYSSTNPVFLDLGGYCVPESDTSTKTTSSHTTPSASPIMCGGLAGRMCPVGFKCKYSEKNPFMADRAGYCVREPFIPSKTTSAPSPTATAEESECGTFKPCPSGQACRAQMSLSQRKVPAPDRFKNVCVPISKVPESLSMTKTKGPEYTPIVPQPY
ncbi:hypothetical protein DM02DRAFT_677639 [Periconia macrospinosa]|uniref:Uncharacterized protein n=1 Tax=Periconia macrospinosa TaxID=97972 RepID=A0A2V1D2K0_9PLEO|nr:hypothetical protein DM02DRAFT_677639 [Periconia macrospinosa]